ncbi:MAG: fumarate hydratase C-terminal domain-containing protein [Nitrospirae bacterium]|nr:fumarate hydratase C-terminal domain-containing protein [Nitrospirota bacterium]MBF0539847.1 fumarate hydratase C-terminal domain-containing protein [Nitrospirota bacterium]
MVEINLKTPLNESSVRALNIGDQVILSGRIFTARDMIHKYLCEIESVTMPFDITGGVLYHCGPIVREINGKYTVISSGPTTSERLEMYEARMIKRFGLRAIIGKGGMGSDTLSALRDFGCVYLQTISGAGVYLSNRVKEVLDVWKLAEFGESEAMWLFEVFDFPAIVTMDSKGNSLHKDILAYSTKQRDEIFSNI